MPVHPIPPVRSPPPTQPLQHHHQYNPVYAQHAAHHPVQPQYAQQFGQFLGVNDATAQMGLHVMGNVMGTGQEYVEQNVLRFVNTGALKPYFNVSTSYVVRKLRLLMFPWRHKPWSRQIRRNEVSGATEGYKPPREDINAPDLYIPGKDHRFPFIANVSVMAFVTYILLSAFLSGIQGHFSPENFSGTASYAFAVVIFEIVAIKLGCYLLNIGGQGQVLDLVAYGGYKFVGIVVTMLVRLAGILGRREGEKKGWGRWIEWSVFLYCFFGLGFFMVCLITSPSVGSPR